MKFTKEEAIEKIKGMYAAKDGNTAKWERTITECVDHAMNLIGSESEMELDGFSGLVIPFLDTTAGFSRKETADLAKELNAQIEELRKAARPQKKQEENEDETTKALLDRIAALERINAEKEERQAVSDKRLEIKRRLTEKGVQNDEWIDLMLSKASVSKDTDAEKESEEYLGMYNRMFADNERTATPKSPKGEPKDRISSVISDAAEISKATI